MDTRFPTGPHPISVPGLIREDASASQPMLRDAVHQAEAATAAPATPTSVRAEMLDKAVAQANEVLAQQGRTLQFSVDKQSGRTVVKVMDSTTGDVIRQIPSEDWLRMVHSMQNKPGSLLRTQA